MRNIKNPEKLIVTEHMYTGLTLGKVHTLEL